MPIDNTVALNVKTPQIADSPLSQFLDIKGKQQQIQAGQIANQSNQAILQERNNVRSLFQNPQDILDENGNIDFNKAGPKIMEAAPTQGGQILTSLISAQKDSATAKTSLLALNEQQRAAAGQFAMSLGQDNPDTAYEKIQAVKKLNPQLAPALDYAWKYHLEPNKNNPDAFRTAALQVGQAAMTPTEQVNAQTPSGVMVTNQSQTGLMNTKPTAGPIGIVPQTIVNNQIPLGERQNVSINPVTGSPMTTVKDAFGNVQGVSQTPTGAGIPQLQPGDKEAIPGLSAERESARTQLNSAPLLHETNRGILSEIDKVSATGAAGPALQRLNSVLGGVLDFSDKEKAASSYDLVGKYLERNALQAAASMGPQTNAGLEAQIKANGSLTYNPTAIKQITKLNDAIVSGTEAYQPGLEKAIAANPQQGVLVKRQFDQQWAQNFDPRIMMIYNASKSGDKAEVNRIINQMGGKNSVAVGELMKKAQNLHILSQNGHL